MGFNVSEELDLNIFSRHWCPELNTLTCWWIFKIYTYECRAMGTFNGWYHFSALYSLFGTSSAFEYWLNYVGVNMSKNVAKYFDSCIISSVSLTNNFYNGAESPKRYNHKIISTYWVFILYSKILIPKLEKMGLSFNSNCESTISRKSNWQNHTFNETTTSYSLS